MQILTTGLQLFAMCLAHTTKGEMHTANSLPCVIHGKELTAYKRRQRALLPWAFCRAHGKVL